MISEYMQQNQSPVIRQEEFEAFTEEVEDTRDSVDQLEASISEMEKSRG